MTRARHDPHSYLPLKAVDFHVLLVLTAHELHGYGIVKEIESRSGGRLRLEPGNLPGRKAPTHQAASNHVFRAIQAGHHRHRG